MGLLALSAMELVLSIDNFVALEALVGELALEHRSTTWRLGASLAMLMRLGLLAVVGSLVWLKAPWLTVGGVSLSIHDLILGFGGVFLITKGASELIQADAGTKTVQRQASAAWVLVQIVIMDLLLSFDSVFTAVGLSQQFWVMATSVVIATFVVIGLRLSFRRALDARPGLKLLVWAMLLVIGVSLLAEACQVELPKWILYAVIVSGWFFERVLTRIRLRGKEHPRE